MIIGHQKNLAFLDSAFENGALSHAYCFAGPDQVGKRAVAQYIGARALGTEPEKLSQHADFLYLEREIDEKKGSLKKNISVAQAKNVGNFLANRSWFGGKKIVIIDEAETINIEAANALLKTLEESVEGNLIVLLTVDAGDLPATVRSRCQHINFSLVSEDEIVRGLLARGFDAVIASKSAAAAWGRPGRAIELAGEKEKMEEYINETGRFEKIMGRPFYEKLAAVEDMFGDKEDAIRGRDRLRDILNLWSMMIRKSMRGQSEEKLSPVKAAGILEEIRAARELLGKNIHPRLIIERILLKI